MSRLPPTRAQYSKLEASYRMCCDEKAKLKIENRQLVKKIATLEKRSEDYLDIYRKLLKYHP